MTNQDAPPPPSSNVSGIIGGLFQAHPWHGVPLGDEAPTRVNCYIEVVPTDTVKYELDKHSGHLKVDRPQTYSNTCPMPYGLIPQTLCSKRVADRCMESTGKKDIVGDQDPIDVCVFSERPIPHGNILLTARVIGGLRMIDNGTADDKLIAVMKLDPAFGGFKDISDIPTTFIDRLKHYFLTYKQQPGKMSPCEIPEQYGAHEARQMVMLAHEDYKDRFGHLHGAFHKAVSMAPPLK